MRAPFALFLRVCALGAVGGCGLLLTVNPGSSALPLTHTDVDAAQVGPTRLETSGIHAYDVLHSSSSIAPPQLSVQRVSYDFADVRLTVSDDVAFSAWVDENGGHQNCVSALQPGSYQLDCEVTLFPVGSSVVRAAANDSQAGTVYGADNVVNPLPVDAPHIYGVLSGDSGLPQQNNETATAWIDPEGADTTWYVAYGTTPSLGSKTGDQVARQSPPAYGAYYSQVVLGGLSPSTTYYYSFVGTNTSGTTTTPAMTFTTAAPATTSTSATTTTTSTTPADEQRPRLASTVLPDGTVGQPYHFPLPISGGSPPYTVALNGFDERMPPGLQLESNGVVDGNPTSAGNFRVNIKVFDQRYPPTSIGPASVFTLTMTIDQHAAGTASTTTTAAPHPAPTIGRTIRLGPRTRSRGCHVTALPDRRCSPGAYFSGLTKTALCSSAFHAGMVPRVSLLENYAVERAYGLRSKSYGGAIEIDRIVPLQLGGSNDVANLFPESGSGKANYHVKDKLESRLHALVCRGQAQPHLCQARDCGGLGGALRGGYLAVNRTFDAVALRPRCCAAEALCPRAGMSVAARLVF